MRTPDCNTATSTITVRTLATVVTKTVALVNSPAESSPMSRLKAPTRMIVVTPVGVASRN